ncbi:unnamed protein product [Phytophthora lilii]|uniref:Unnamed protein product n=1 Tax=Phytophthora lilii TaxID=2077276 RepID=A0A9W6WPD7_9STRA|nr:unnamed protein product [Phytophthora lilii]
MHGDFKSWTPLTAAYFSGYSEFVQLIYEREIADENDPIQLLPTSPAEFTNIARPSATIDKRQRNEDTALRIACERGTLQFVETLLEKRDDINMADSNGLTPLMNAASNGYADIVRLLIFNGVIINHQRSDGATALDLACANGQVGAI